MKKTTPYKAKLFFTFCFALFFFCLLFLPSKTFAANIFNGFCSVRANPTLGNDTLNDYNNWGIPTPSNWTKIKINTGTQIALSFFLGSPTDGIPGSCSQYDAYIAVGANWRKVSTCNDSYNSIISTSLNDFQVGADANYYVKFYFDKKGVSGDSEDYTGDCGIVAAYRFTSSLNFTNSFPRTFEATCGGAAQRITDVSYSGGTIGYIEISGNNLHFWADSSTCPESTANGAYFGAIQFDTKWAYCQSQYNRLIPDCYIGAGGTNTRDGESPLNIDLIAPNNICGSYPNCKSYATLISTSGIGGWVKGPNYVNPPSNPPSNTGNLYGRVFVDSDNNLARPSTSEALMGTSDPQIFVRYRPSGGSWTFASNTTCCNTSWSDCTTVSGPYTATNLAAGEYDVHTYINVGPGWAFSEPSTNKLGILTGSNCTFSSGTLVNGQCNQRDSSGFCTDVTISDVSIDAGATTYLWFGIRRTQGTISGYVFIDDNENGLKDDGESFYNLEDTSWVTCTGQGSSVITSSEYSYSYGLSNGTYYLGMILPANYAVTGWNDGETASLEQTAEIQISSSTDNKTVNFGITYSPSPWFLIDKGDIGSKGSISISVPTSKTLIENINGGAIAQGTISLGKGTLGPEGVFEVKNYEQSLSAISFSSLWDLAKNKQEFDPLTTSISSLSSGSYYVNSNLTLDEEISLTNQNLVIYVGNKSTSFNLNINNNINIDDNSTLIFIVNGDINIDSSVATINAYLYAGNDLYTGTTEGLDTSLSIYGGLLTSETGTLHLQRDLGEEGNLLNPGEKIYHQPRYYIKLSEIVGKRYMTWTEAY